MNGWNTILFFVVLLFFRYIPTDVEQQKSLIQWEACMFIVYNTRAVYENILRWAYFCALTEACIAPTYEVICGFVHQDRFKTYCGCHRFDQATFNILLSNWFHYDIKRYTEGRRQFGIQREPCDYEFELKYCGKWLPHSKPWSWYVF